MHTVQFLYVTVIVIVAVFLQYPTAQAQSITQSINIAPEQLWGQCSDGVVNKVFVNVTTKSSIGLDGVYIVDKPSYEKLRSSYNDSSTTPPADLLRYNGQVPVFDENGQSALSCEKNHGFRVRNCTMGTATHGGVMLSPEGVACLVVSNAVSAMAVPVNVTVAFGEAASNMTTGDAVRSNRYDGTLLLAIIIAAVILAR